MWIKICGNTNLEDAQLSASLGADALGFVFAPSARQVTPAQVAVIVAQLPGNLEIVGVFPAWPADQIIYTVHQARLTTVQLHGGPDAALLRALTRQLDPTIRIISVLHWDLAAGPAQAAEVLTTLQQLQHTRILIDSKSASQAGGTGIPFDWPAAKPLFAAHPQAILAGGLTPENVAAAIAQLNPYGVDVVSGVEAYKGKKDRHKLEQFIQAARHPGTHPDQPLP